MGHKNNSKGIIEPGKDIRRRSFLKKWGILSGMGIIGWPFPYLHQPAADTNAYKLFVPNMENTTYWEMLMFSCLQGLVNRHQASVFLYYPDKSKESWYSRYPVDDQRYFYNWYKSYSHLSFQELDSPYDLFRNLESMEYDKIEGYVIVDTEVPVTANIAANYASIESLLPVAESVLQNHKDDLPDWPVQRDLRGQFGEMSKIETYEWAFQHQWPQANHARVANLGTPEPGDEIRTNSFFTSNRARDFTVAEQGFFFDLESKGESYDLKDRILQAMEPNGYVFGWHQGAGETKHITHLSKHGQLSLGTSTYAGNFSFHSRVLVPGAAERFRNKVLRSERKVTLQDKVYLTFVLSDGDSLNFLMRRGQGGQWQLSSRGKIPFGWEIQPLMVDIAPGILDYFQATATENDFFVNGVSGIGYFYPEEMPEDHLRQVLELSVDYIKKTGLSELTVMGPPNAVSDKTMRIYQVILGGQLTGVMEGYDRRKADTAQILGNADNETVWLPTSTPEGEHSVENWVKGLKKVAESRTHRPLFIPVHVPAHRLTITDVVNIVEQLSGEFQVVSPGDFYTLFKKARKDSVIIAPPESFESEIIKLSAGQLNTIRIEVQNFSRDEKKVDLNINVFNNSDDRVTVHQTVKLMAHQKRQFELEVFIPRYFKDSTGQVIYSINKEQQVTVPTEFL